MVILRICFVSIRSFPFILFPIIVLHQLGIRATFDPHAVTQTSFQHLFLRHFTTITKPTTKQPPSYISTHHETRKKAPACKAKQNQKKKKILLPYPKVYATKSVRNLHSQTTIISSTTRKPTTISTSHKSNPTSI